MPSPRTERPRLAPMAGVLLVSSLVLGVRAYGAVRAVLSGNQIGTAAQLPALSPTLAHVALLDSLVTAAEPPRRDPFRDVVIEGPIRSTGAPSPAKEDPRPVLRALLYDKQQPTAQISLGGATSGWLRVGDDFLGWKVTAIDAAAVRLSRAGEVVVLP